MGKRDILRPIKIDTPQSDDDLGRDIDALVDRLRPGDVAPDANAKVLGAPSNGDTSRSSMGNGGEQALEMRKQAFRAIYLPIFESLKVRISGAEDEKTVKELRHGGGKVKYKFFNINDFAEYFNNQLGKEGEAARREAFNMLDVAEEELQILYEARRKQLREPGEKSLSNEKLFLLLSEKLRTQPRFSGETGGELVIESITPDKIIYNYRQSGKRQGLRMTTTPDKVKGFIKFLKTNFDWELSIPTVQPAAKKRRGHVPQQLYDKYDAARTRRNGLTDEEKDYKAKMAARAKGRAGSGVGAKSEPGSRTASAATGGKEEREEEKMKQFVEGLPEGAIIKFISPGGKVVHFRRDGADLLVGKKGNDIGTGAAWKHFQDKWSLDVEEEKNIPSKKPVAATSPAPSVPKGVVPLEPLPGSPIPPRGPEPAAAALEPGVMRSPETVPAASSQATPEAKVAVDFEKLEKNLEEARNNYAKHDFENTSKLRKLSAFFRLDKAKYEGLDVDGAKAKYDEAFQALLNARLADIHRRKDAGELNEENYRLEMGRALTSFECEGRIQIPRARQEVKMERLAQSKVGRLIEAFPRMAHWYNKLPKAARYTIGITLGVGAFLTAPVSGAVVTSGAAAAATWIALARGTLSGMSTFALLDTELERRSDNRAKAATTKSGGTMFAEYERLAPENRTPEAIAAAKEQFFTEKLAELHGHFKARKREMVIRKSAAVIAGVAFGTAVGSGWLGEKIKGLFGWFGGVPSIEAHSGDSTWKLLGQYLSAKDSHFAGMNEAQKTYAIDALKDKLAAMSPDQLKSAGFGSGDIGKLGIGEHINFDKLVGGNVAEAMKGASGLSPDDAASIIRNNAKILEWAKAHPDIKLTDSLIDNTILSGHGANTHAGGAVIERLMEDGDDPDYTAHTVRVYPTEENIDDPVSDLTSDAQPESGGAANTPGQPATVIDVEEIDDTSSESGGADTSESSGPVSPSAQEASAADAPPSFTEELQPRVDDWSRQILGMESISDRQELLKAPITYVFRDFRDGTSLSGLNPEQVNNFAKFMASAREATGNADLMREILRTNPNATAGDFLKTVAPLVEQGTRLGVYSTTR